MNVNPMVWRHLFLIALLFGLAGCGRRPANEGEAVADTSATAPAASRVRATSPAPTGPPAVENDAPAGICEDTANLLSRVDRVEPGLFRAVALDNRAGSNDGDGIRGIRFAIAGEGISYAHDETSAPYCIFGSNEPDCGEWPRDEAGQYTWGVDGPTVRPGRYDVFVEVVGETADSLSGSDRCDWSFAIIVNAP